MVFVFRFSLCVLAIQVSAETDYINAVSDCKTNDAPLWTYNQRSTVQCLALCNSDEHCKSVSYNSNLAQCIGMNVLTPSCPNFTTEWPLFIAIKVGI